MTVQKCIGIWIHGRAEILTHLSPKSLTADDAYTQASRIVGGRGTSR